MQATTLKNRINLSHAKAIRRSRELLKLTRKEMASRLGISFQAVEKYESGRAIIDEERRSP
ncbi:MAG: helix-turn-helix transcriptional regulator [Bdellovibrionales bacterium]|nr:helix-turn-helix transcriptional regulator [Bdellovibrionales bacterium]